MSKYELLTYIQFSWNDTNKVLTNYELWVWRVAAAWQSCIISQKKSCRRCLTLNGKRRRPYSQARIFKIFDYLQISGLPPTVGQRSTYAKPTEQPSGLWTIGMRPTGQLARDSIKCQLVLLQKVSWESRPRPFLLSYINLHDNLLGREWMSNTTTFHVGITNKDLSKPSKLANFSRSFRDSFSAVSTPVCTARTTSFSALFKLYVKRTYLSVCRSRILP